MKRLRFAFGVKWETVRKEFGIRALLDAFLAGFVYATLLVVPLVAVLVELMLLNFHRLYTFVILYILVGAGYLALVHRFAYVALRLKRPHHESDAGGLLRILATGWIALAVAAGIVILVFVIPGLTA